MHSRPALVVLVGALTGLLVMAVTSPWPGPWGRVLVSAGDHGVHLSDLPAAALWGLGLVALLRLRVVVKR